MTETINTAVPYTVLFSHVLLAGLVVAFLFRKSWGKDIFEFVGKNAVTLAFVCSIGAVLGSLFYSQVIGFEPCVLCWWQRVFLFPLVIIFGVALKKKIVDVWAVALPLAGLAFVTALYQSYANLSGNSIFACTKSGGTCDRLYVNAFGYITIPTMSLTVAVYILVIYLFARFYKSER